MALVVCPRCNAPNDSPPDAGGRQSCVICNHQWIPQAAVSASAAPVPALQKKARPRATISQEYMPDDPASEAARALTSRQSSGQAADGGVRAPPQKRQGAAAAELKPHSDRSHGGVIPPLKALPSKEPTPAVNRVPLVQGIVRPAPSTPTVEVDMDLFDRLEKEAQVARSKQNTVAELIFDPQGTPLPVGDGSPQTLACPVCGHSFLATANVRAQTCPQCHTTFDHASGRFSSATAGEIGDLLIGRNLKGCVIDRKLGEGGMGSVYHAKQLSLDRSVAIKVLPPDLARNRNFIQRFEREAKSLAKINHPNILHIYDFGEEASLKLYFMIIEFVDGTDLGEVLNRRNTLPQLEVLDMLRQSSMGLEMAAAKGVIHRDIKPDNLMIASDGICKVSDFGLAKGYGDENEVTSVGVRVGTPAFMSPEQCDGVEVDWRSDVYNLGCTAFLCLTGRLPFDGETPFSIMLKHKNEAIPSVRDISPSIEPSVDRLVRNMLAKKPADRCDSWHALIEEIENIEVQLSGDPNVVRKTRGQMQALGRATAGLPAVRDEGTRLRTPPPLRPSPPRNPPGPPSAVEQTATAPSTSPSQLPDWLRPVDLPPPALSTTTMAGTGSGSSLPQVRTAPAATATSAEQGRAAVPGSRSNLATVGVATSSSAEVHVPERPSKRLNAEIASARDRGMRNEAESLAASGERLFAAGSFVEAAKDFRKASELTPDAEDGQHLRKRAAEARRRGRLSRVGRRLLWMVVVLALLALLAWKGTPLAHNFTAQRAYEEIAASTLDPQQRIERLRAFVDEQRPYAWYQMVFMHGYALAAVSQAQHEIDSSVKVQAVPVLAQEDGNLRALEAELTDASVSWPDLADRASAMLRTAIGRDKERVQAVLDKAQAETASMSMAISKIQQALAAGAEADALAQAESFRAQQQRAGRFLSQLPLPGRVSVVTEEGVAVSPVLQLDGQALPPGTLVFARRADRDVELQVGARGYATQRLSVPADTATDEHVFNVSLHVAPMWVHALGRGLGDRICLHAAADGVYVQRDEGITLLRAVDGETQGQVDPLPGVQGPSYTPMWIEDATANRILIASVDGEVKSIDPRTLAIQEVLHKGPAPVLAWIEVQLTYQANEKNRYLIEQSRSTFRLVAMRGEQELWPYQALRGHLQPALLHIGDRVVVIDDSSVHFLEEDGSNVDIRNLPSPRTGPLLRLPADSGMVMPMVMPTASGVQWLHFGRRDQPLVVGDDRVLTSVGPGLLVVDGHLLAVAHSDSIETLMFNVDHFDQRWHMPLDIAPVEIGAGQGIVAISDAKGRITLFGEDAGEVVGRIVHPLPLAGAPVLVDGMLVVADTDGNVSAYALPHATAH